jgi:biopolymer transport protein ExbD
MAFSSSGGGRGVRGNINVTPLVDVVLVLLIIFMVITPMMQQGKDIQLPKAKKSPDEKSKTSEPFVVALSSEAQLYIEGQPVDRPALRARIERELAVDANRKILLKGDERLTVKEVRLALQEMREAGAKGVSLGVEEEKAAK